MQRPNIKIDLPRLTGELERLSRISDAEAPAVTRVLFTEPDLKARAYFRGLFADAGLAVREDPAGNLFARWIGSQPDLPVLGTGSHTDAIPFSGMYDGTVGVLGGLEAIRALQRSGWKPRRSIELLLFTSEEPTRFGIGCVGSRLLSGSLSPEAGAALKDKDGATFEEVRQRAGCSGKLSAVRIRDGYYAAFVELHIEQGPLLEREEIPIGAVTAIAAPAALRVRLDGEGGHAGAVLMPQRRDALCAAAEIVLAVEKAARSAADSIPSRPPASARFTPACNSIPSRVILEIDIRDTDLAARDRAVDQIARRLPRVRRDANFAPRSSSSTPTRPPLRQPAIVNAIQTACRELNLACKPMVSRAYHDSLFMARICPTGMIFIPCRAGVSHRPDEYSSPEAIGRGVEVLALTLAELDESLAN